MGWHYAAKEFKESNGDTYYGLVEVYPDIGSNVHTENEVTINAESIEALKKWLQQAISDIDNYPTITDPAVNTYTIWQEGYAITGNSAPASIYASDIKATSFQQACDIAGLIDEHYDSKTLTTWGCKLFDNEADARKNFG